MPLAEQLAAAITSAPNFAAIDNLARLTWRGLAEGHIAESDAEALGIAVEARRAVFRGGQSQPRFSPSNRSSGQLRPGTRPPRSPDRQRSIERRRRQATSGILPSQLACHFTTGQVAVLAVVGRQVKNTGQCGLPVDAIAAMAGVCRTMVKAALREAARLGLITVQERPRPGRKHDTNIVAITSVEWQTWLKIGPGDRGQKCTHHGIRINSSNRDEPGNLLSSGSVPVYTGHKQATEGGSCIKQRNMNYESYA